MTSAISSIDHALETEIAMKSNLIIKIHNGSLAGFRFYARILCRYNYMRSLVHEIVELDHNDSFASLSSYCNERGIRSPGAQEGYEAPP